MFQEDLEFKEARESLKPIFIWIPAIFTALIIIFCLIMKFSESTKDSFMSWGWIVTTIILCTLISFGMSIIIYFLTSYKSAKPKGFEYNGRAFCDKKIRDEIKSRTNYNLGDFTQTGDSTEGVGYYGENGEDLVYYHLYRIKEGSKNRYFLGVMNMRKDRSDLLTIVQSPMNFSNLQQLIDDLSQKLTPKPRRTIIKEKEYIDEVAGRRSKETEEKPYNEDEEEIDD